MRDHLSKLTRRRRTDVGSEQEVGANHEDSRPEM
jgi:hypothetical protein